MVRAPLLSHALTRSSQRLCAGHPVRPHVLHLGRCAESHEPKGAKDACCCRRRRLARSCRIHSAERRVSTVHWNTAVLNGACAALHVQAAVACSSVCRSPSSSTTCSRATARPLRAAATPRWTPSSRSAGNFRLFYV
eukprot:4237547-Pleurochrysis_carterae.AAC.3